jgi:NAD(P)-dependent dehydrogenase (short-subunit alcohol dehydrogenase family)
MVLQGKNIVVIGGTSGLGLSAVRAFIAQGANVLAVGADTDASKAASELKGDSIEIVLADARGATTAKNAIAHCVDRFGAPDGLYHVAGGSGRGRGDGPLHLLTEEGWDHTLELNLRSLMLSNQAAVQYWLDTGRPGTILNMCSVLAYAPSPHFFATHAYAAAKAAIIGFSKSVAAYYAKDNIRVNILAPGLVETPMSKRAATDASIQAFVKTKQPLEGGRMGQASDLDGLAVYFMSDQSAFTTGQLIAVDGGWSVSEGQY